VAEASDRKCRVTDKKNRIPSFKLSYPELQWVKKYTKCFLYLQEKGYNFQDNPREWKFFF
jgi:hypothetical protein